MASGKKTARRRKAWIFFEDESGVSQRPSIRRTWAPRGETPVLIHAFDWSTISVCAAMGFRWDGRRSQLFFQTRKGNYPLERACRLFLPYGIPSLFIRALRVLGLSPRIWAAPPGPLILPPAVSKACLICWA